jgi:L-threonylcarbamoyladenylate synthase
MNDFPTKIAGVQPIVSVLSNGGVVLLPTDTVYGLAALPTCAAAVEKIYAIKARPSELFLPIMVSGVAAMDPLGVELPQAARRLLVSDLVPGAITFILGFSPVVQRPAWLNDREEIAVRIPSHELLLSILEETGPLLVTSANHHGSPVTLLRISDILPELAVLPELIIDDGECHDIPSTIINCRHDPPVLERSGVISSERIHQILTNG